MNVNYSPLFRDRKQHNAAHQRAPVDYSEVPLGNPFRALGWMLLQGGVLRAKDSFFPHGWQYYDVQQIFRNPSARRRAVA